MGALCTWRCARCSAVLGCPGWGITVGSESGSGWLGIQFNRLASRLSDQAYVVVPDLRGHGASPERRGDVDYIGQMEDDIAALIETERLPGQAVILAGHSSGGGLVTRFAGGEHGSKLIKLSSWLLF